MSVNQLSLWDNEALETGYRCLSNMELEKAESHFTEALNGAFGNTAWLKRAIQACRDWRSLLVHSQDTNEKNGSGHRVHSILSTYLEYPFTPPMKQFRKALLSHIVSLLYEVDLMDLKNVETAFDLLLEMKDYNKTEEFIEVAINQYPENTHLLYMQAQVQWLNGEKSKANKTYILLLLHDPGKMEKDRIENNELIVLLDNYGAAMAPAYGLLHNVAPSISLPDEIRHADDKHKKALECYRLILAANKSLSDHDVRSSIQYRKRLKERSPELFQEYFKWVQKRQ